MTRRRLWGQALLGVLVVAFAAWWLWNTAADRAAFRHLDDRFSGSGEFTCDVSLKDDFVRLLSSDDSQQHLHQLAAKHDSIVFLEGRKAVYYTHPRTGQRPTSCIGTVALEGDAGGPLVGHSGIPGYLTALGLGVDGEALLLRCRASTAEDSLATVEHNGLRPGGVYDVTLGLESTSGTYATFSDHGEFRPAGG